MRPHPEFSSLEYGKENFGILLLTKDPELFMLGFSLKDEQHKGLSLYSRCPSNLHPAQASPSRPPAPAAGPPAPQASPPHPARDTQPPCSLLQPGSPK